MPLVATVRIARSVKSAKNEKKDVIERDENEMKRIQLI
jgi:hypothetical protein